jgi:hypothetical protein
MTAYVEYDGGDFKYETSVSPNVGDSIIYEKENECVTYYLKVLSVAHYTNGSYSELHINAELELKENG